MNFKKGLKDGFPIALGYISVAFAFGVLTVDKGLPFWYPILISITNFTGTGQFAGIELLAIGATLIELFTTMLIINIRYSLMSLSLSQKILGFPLWQRCIIAFGVTDENYAVAINQYNKLTFSYLVGLISCSFCGWISGTILGSVLGNIFSTSLMNAFGIALYAMFIAIIIPSCKEEKSVFLLVVCSITFSCLFYFLPFLNKLSEGWVIIIGSILCASIISLIFPKKLVNNDIE